MSSTETVLISDQITLDVSADTNVTVTIPVLIVDPDVQQIVFDAMRWGANSEVGQEVSTILQQAIGDALRSLVVPPPEPAS